MFRVITSPEAEAVLPVEAAAVVPEEVLEVLVLVVVPLELEEQEASMVMAMALAVARASSFLSFITSFPFTKIKMYFGGWVRVY
jgi:hypothetical protein